MSTPHLLAALSLGFRHRFLAHDEIADGSLARRTLGHLDGWGFGKGGAEYSFNHPRSRGSTGTAYASWVVRGSGRATVTVRGARTGVVSVGIDLA